MTTMWLSKSGDHIFSRRRLPSRLSVSGFACQASRSNISIVPS
ncbi:hypothetical protein LINPERHAP2_LOCUS39002 [Linum perenne]